jgi:hypothetical protein
LGVRLILIYTLLAGAAFAADDPGGWSKAKWGMNEIQLADAFGADLIHTGDPSKAIHLAVDVALADVPFRAELALDKDGKLAHVLLTPRRDKDADEFLFEHLQDALVLKYGRPWKSTAGHSTKYQWSFPATSITLSIFQDKELGACMISLSYDRRADDSL